ncbi:MAG: hypothetical protein M3042_08460 [Actinomycetota bacterium]|nr:hypothetical protein [Actinomycetota bacterium]
MTDPLDRILQPPEIDPLAPPAGHFDEIVRRARSRRHRRAAAATGLLTAAVVAGAVVGTSLLVAPTAGHAPANTASPSVTASGPPPAPGPSTPAPTGSTGATRLPGSLGTGPVPAHFTPWSVSSVSAQVSFVLGDAPCSRPPCTSLVVTGDGGRTWHGLPAPRAALLLNRFGGLPSKYVSEVRFANLSDGWVFGGGLYATHDGGRHWRDVGLSSLTVQQLETDGQTAYAVAATCSVTDSVCRDYRLYQAAAGSDTWRAVPGIGPQSSLDLALSGRRGILASASGLWVRTGGGWQRRNAVPCPAGAGPVSASASGNRLFAFCGEGAAGSLYLSPWASDDNGASWVKVADGSARATNGHVSVAAASATLVLVGSANPDLGGSVLRSSDGGRTFAGSGLPRLSDGWWYVGARTATSLVALPGRPDGSIWTSRDSGRTWQAYRFR